MGNTLLGLVLHPTRDVTEIVEIITDWAPSTTSPTAAPHRRAAVPGHRGRGGVHRADTVFLGFGLEGLPPAARNDLVARSLTHLIGRPRH